MLTNWSFGECQSLMLYGYVVDLHSLRRSIDTARNVNNLKRHKYRDAHNERVCHTIIPKLQVQNIRQFSEIKTHRIFIKIPSPAYTSIFFIYGEINRWEYAEGI
jgi:hypothetical protein